MTPPPTTTTTTTMSTRGSVLRQPKRTAPVAGKMYYSWSHPSWCRKVNTYKISYYRASCTKLVKLRLDCICMVLCVILPLVESVQLDPFAT